MKPPFFRIRRWLIEKLIGKRFAVLANIDIKEPTKLYIPTQGNYNPIYFLGLRGLVEDELTIVYPKRKTI